MDSVTFPVWNFQRLDGASLTMAFSIDALTGVARLNVFLDSFCHVRESGFSLNDFQFLCCYPVVCGNSIMVVVKGFANFPLGTKIKSSDQERPR